MKKLITYLTLIVCIYANSQDKTKELNYYTAQEAQYNEKVNALNQELTKFENDWRNWATKEIVALKQKVNNQQLEIESLKQQLENQTANIEDVISLLGITTYKEDELPKNFKPDEVGVAFVKDENNLSIGVCINNHWKFFKL